jgi:hypothetical protein
MKDTHRISIASPPDRERLVAEIFFGDVQWAELNQESDILELEFYPRPDGQPWRIEFSNAINALSEAKARLASFG